MTYGVLNDFYDGIPPFILTQLIEEPMMEVHRII